MYIPVIYFTAIINFPIYKEVVNITNGNRVEYLRDLFGKGRIYSISPPLYITYTEMPFASEIC